MRAVLDPKKVLAMYLIENMSLDAIAKECGVSRPTVRANLAPMKALFYREYREKMLRMIQKMEVEDLANAGMLGSDNEEAELTTKESV